MRIVVSILTSALLLLPAVAGAQQTDVQQLRSDLEALRADYESRIADLEQRLAVAEQNARQARQVAAQPPSSQGGAAVRGQGQSAFNPAIGVIFQGYAWNYSENVDEYAVQGFPFGGEAGPVDEGLVLGETELILNANVDDKFSAWLTAALALEDGEAVVEVEEAWVEATALPAGFGAKFGRFFSSIGYLNNRHSHTWDFADQPLPYQAFLGDQYLDDGVQLRWIAPTDLYVEIGGELLRGGRYPAGGAADSGFGSYSLFAKLGGDIGSDSSWLAGISYLDAEALERASGDEDDPYLFDGNTSLTSAQFVWKWAPEGNWKQRNLVFQTELFRRNEEGIYQGPDLSPSAYDVDQRGWYAQAVYQPWPRWRFGGRVDGLSSDDAGELFADTSLASPSSDPRRYSIMVDWSNSEFSRLRLQFTNDETRLADDRQWGIQYIHSIGAHGAHSF